MWPSSMFRSVEQSLVALLAVILLVSTALAHPICVDSSAPFKRASGTFTLCSKWNGLKTCVGPADEATSIHLPTFVQNNPPSAACRHMLTDISCSIVDQWSGHLFRAEGPGEALPVPFLCPDYCQTLYATCKDAQMSNSPFVDDSATPTTIKTRYSTAEAFCGAFADPEYCFKGVPFTVPPPVQFTPQFSLCTERVVSGGNPKVNIAPIPGHANLIAIGDLEGLIRIYRVNNAETGTPFVVDGTLLDIRSKVESGGERGLLGLAFHKNFFNNGRFYVSFSCASGAGINCNLGDSVVDEYRVVDSKVSNGLSANLITRRRIFQQNQPYSNHNGGQLLFSPDSGDPHLYFMLGDGGSGGDPQNRAQPLTTYLGKVLRMDVNVNFATNGQAAAPSDNPFVGVSGALGMIWANGLRNPWRCSFDRQTHVMYCGDVGQGRREEVDIIVRGANYGWRKFEGTRVYNGNTVLLGSGVHTPPIISYDHSEISSSGFASVTGGYVVRTDRDERMQNKYVFADIAGPLFLAQESPPSSGQWSKARVGSLCSPGSPLPCVNRGGILSFGEMINGDILFADDSGNVFRFIEASRCPTRAPTPRPRCQSLSLRKCRQRRDCVVRRRRRCVARGSG